MGWLQLPLETRSHMFRQYITATVYSDKVVQQHVAPCTAAADRFSKG